MQRWVWIVLVSLLSLWHTSAGAVPWLKQSTAITIRVGPFLDSVDGNSEENALTIAQADVQLSKNAGTFAQKNDTTACTATTLGFYTCPLNTTDTNTLGILDVVVHESGALIVHQRYMVVPANVWDSFFSTDRLQVDVQEIGADVITATSIATDAIGAAELAASAIGASELATDAVGAAELATDALAEINAEVDTALNTAIPGSPTAGSVNAILRILGLQWVACSVDDTTPAAGDFTLAAGLSSTDNTYNRMFLLFTEGTQSGQARAITTYTGALRSVAFSGTGTALDAPFPAAPANGDDCILIGRGQ